MENDRLKSQFKYANAGQGLVIPDLEGQYFDIDKLRERYKEHVEKYSQLRRDFKETKENIWGMRETMLRWREIFRKHDVDFEEEFDIWYNFDAE